MSDCPPFRYHDRDPHTGVCSNCGEIVPPLPMPPDPTPARTVDYPECEKLAAVCDERNAICEFVDWLSERGIHLCSVPPEYDHTYMPVLTNTQRLVHDFLEIDDAQLEAERRAMIADSVSRADGLRKERTNG